MVSEGVLLQDKLERHKSQCGDNCLLHVSRGCTCVVFFWHLLISDFYKKVSAEQNKKKIRLHETKCQMISKPWKRIPLFYINLVFAGFPFKNTRSVQYLSRSRFLEGMCVFSHGCFKVRLYNTCFDRGFASGPLSDAVRQV